MLGEVSSHKSKLAQFGQIPTLLHVTATTLFLSPVGTPFALTEIDFASENTVHFKLHANSYSLFVINYFLLLFLVSTLKTW